MTDWDLFPPALAKPIPLRDALAGLQDKGMEPQNACENKRNLWGATQQGSNHPKRFGLQRLAWGKVSPTLCKSTSGSGGLMHPDSPRELYEGELKRIASFPTEYRFAGSWRQVHERLGNCVPPLLMRAVALSIKSRLFGGAPLQPFPRTMTYSEILDEAWAEHLAPRQDGAPTVISTFAGGGGSSLGYSMAGYNELLAVEWDANAVEVLKANFPHTEIYHGDIAKISVEECLERTGLKAGELDIFDGSPPCQGFSTAGRRVMEDDRNQLFREFTRLLRGLEPKVFVMENVYGMVKGKMKLVFAEIMRELKASGYDVKCKLLNAKYFHVPQSRDRLIFIGVREDLGKEPSYPKAEKRIITAGEVCDEDSGVDISKYAIHGEALKLKAGGQSDKYMSLIKARRSKPLPTLTAAAGFGMSSACVIKWNNKKFTVTELKKLMSFPVQFQLKGSYLDSCKRLGNAVPPLLIRAVAGNIRRAILQNKVLT